MQFQASAAVITSNADRRERRNAVWPFSRISLEKNALEIRCVWQTNRIATEDIDAIIIRRHLFSEFQIFVRIHESRIVIYISVLRGTSLRKRLQTMGLSHLF